MGRTLLGQPGGMEGCWKSIPGGGNSRASRTGKEAGSRPGTVSGRGGGENWLGRPAESWAWPRAVRRSGRRVVVTEDGGWWDAVGSRTVLNKEPEDLLWPGCGAGGRAMAPRALAWAT